MVESLLGKEARSALPGARTFVLATRPCEQISEAIENLGTARSGAKILLERIDGLVQVASALPDLGLAK